MASNTPQPIPELISELQVKLSEKSSKENSSEDVKSDPAAPTEQLPEAESKANAKVAEKRDIDDIDIDDIVILRRDPTTNRNIINKSAYVRLHRPLSPESNRAYIDFLKVRYERPEDEDVVDERKSCPLPGSSATPDDHSIESFRKKYPPAIFGYSSNSKLQPVPKPRKITRNKPLDRWKVRNSLPNRRNAQKDENSNELPRKTSSSSEELITIITRSESEGSIDKFERELNLFTMDTKPVKKKRSNSFRKIFSGKLFGKSPKKKDEEEPSKLPCKENVVYSDNFKNETNDFSRQSQYRHTLGGYSGIPKPTKVDRNHSQLVQTSPNYDNMKQMELRYAQMHIGEFNNIKRNFENRNSNPTYVQNIKPPPAPNPSSTNSSRRYTDTGSSNSASDSGPIYQNGAVVNATRPYLHNGSRDTPPQAQELRKDVRLVNPKALIPINSERPLPNPYHQNERSFPDAPKISPKPIVDLRKSETRPPAYPVRFNKPVPLEESYGTVFDNIPTRDSTKLESTKLRLPSNREIFIPSPSLKSPIPDESDSVAKSIATELLRSSRSPTPTRRTRLSSPLRTNRNTEHEYAPRAQFVRKLPTRSTPDINNTLRQETYASFQELPNKDPWVPVLRNGNIQMNSWVPPVDDKVTTNAMVHVNSYNNRPQSPNNFVNNRSLLPMRPLSARSSTPDMRTPTSSKSQSPQKEDIRRSVEAYYWKEIKKLKEQENLDNIYYYQMQTPYGYVEEPINIRRSRSSSPAINRNGGRSLSLPRDPRVVGHNPYGRLPPPNSIPEGRVAVRSQPIYDQNLFQRNVPQRQTMDNVQKSPGNVPHKPVYRANSFSVAPRSMQNPRLEITRQSYVDDDVFLPNQPSVVDGKEIYGYANKPNLQPEYYIGHQSTEQQQSPYEVYPNTRPVQVTPPRESLYGPLVVANVRQRQPENQSLYGPLVVANNQQPEPLQVKPVVAVNVAPHRQAPMQIREQVYGQRPPMTRRESTQSETVIRQNGQQPQGPNQSYGIRREIIMKDEIFGQFGGYLPPNGYKPKVAVQNNAAESTYGYGRGGQRQVPVRNNLGNNVGDIYGQTRYNYSPIQQSGVVLGQLQGTQHVVRQSFSQIPNGNFPRNTRLTASANDMYRQRRYQNVDPRYQNNAVYDSRQRQMAIQEDLGPPNRPLPPVPAPSDKKNVNLRGSAGPPPLESVPNRNDAQLKSSKTKSKKRSFFGKSS